MRKDKINAAIGIFIIVVIFLAVSYLVQSNLDYVRSLIGVSPTSMIIYILILIFATVVAPVNATPLLPVASNIWGWFLTGILTIIGETIGSIIAFSLARKYGVPLVKKFVPINDIAKYEKLIPEGNIFWSIVFLRISVPVDILSYILGLFSRVKFKTYFFATLIGISPLAFILAYIGTLSIFYQIITFITAVLIILLGYIIGKKYKRKKLMKESIKESMENVKSEKYLS